MIHHTITRVDNVIIVCTMTTMTRPRPDSDRTSLVVVHSPER